ncbi:sodium:solute symporter family transporter [Mucilaginibacter flavus]|uniref:sodium:solute symporter family transporter n=1 Tax=Mucilaginibacter flavus TaxID=931504 RepID=UPI0025B3BC1A|nr:sodium/solute symporter [Mucilaginibacter flavus]MDN3581455.1 sodium/solute symporter [Mucilaginibacter flavus]
MNKFSTIDYVIFVIYFIVVSGYGYWVYSRKKKASISASHDFFLAEGSLTWWAIGASLIASNISAEQFIGTSGQGFAVGLAVAAYEWVAAIALIIVAVWFIPVYLKNKIFTMPQFLHTRYNETVSFIMAIFWLFLYIFVNLTSILYLGALAINNLIGGDMGSMHIIIIALAVFALFITLGGMKVIGFTDVIQVLVLVIGGLATTYIALTLVSEHFGLGKDAMAGLKTMFKDSPEHFKMMMSKPKPGAPQAEITKYLALPGIAMYFAGQWIVNLNYWGCNQYITQRALGANLKTARTGILFAGLMKLAMPIIVVIPGIAAYVLYKNGGLQQEMASGGHFNSDNAYSAILGFLPTGLKGLSVAALTAAIVASLAGKANSISTIFTLDIYKKHIAKDADESKMVWVGKLTILAALIFSILLTWKDMLGISGEGGFTYIQKYTGYISPGIFAIFILGFFWKRTTGAAAIVGILMGFAMSVLFNNFAPALFGHETFLYTAFPNGKGGWEIPFLICMGLSFLFTIIAMVAVSLAGPKINPKAFDIPKAMFKVEKSTMALIIVTLLLLTMLYVKFW